MMRSLWTAASGMVGQQYHIDTVANNLSNVNTTGFKKNRVDFQDLIYQTVRMAGTPATEVTVVPTPTQVGHGVRVAASSKIFTQGALQHTDNVSDLAIQGEGFFRVLLYDGTYAYTRDGSFKIDSNGQLVTSNGYRLIPEIVLPEGFIADTLSVSEDGRVTVKVPGQDDPVEVGQIQIYRFVNPSGLLAVGDNLYKVTNASGDPIGGRPGFDGMGKLLHKFLEMSNVSVVNEMVEMIVAQRAYELNSKAVQTSDSMLGTAVNLKR
ncbi:flagellar basal-body rod protein FlgG [Spirochaeta thermophila DSM 6578]|uniref:Flagellar basal-body rod protein FlgG n=1 Tax=Winmispira thermophila (strain ATCC 700085 / DSM 6578 / Z-1203) TaxID=869211 RepID=G0GA04_WINT7|nr:flagellar basal-body rod protein FlgG [Spirochaeta thermophila]AEJ61692.1 flagellar basal-body rod protein FlgG [Spirochaeta thermophila DSM 6578]